MGDILISLTPRETTTSSATRTSTIITTATTTAMTPRQVSAVNQRVASIITSTHNSGSVHPSIVQTVGNPLIQVSGNLHKNVNSLQQQPLHLGVSQNLNRPPQSLSPESLARKRRWSAPDQICDENEQAARRSRIE